MARCRSSRCPLRDAADAARQNLVEVLTEERPQMSEPRDRYVYYPDCAEVPEAAGVFNVGCGDRVSLLDLQHRAHHAPPALEPAQAEAELASIIIQPASDAPPIRLLRRCCGSL